MRCDFAASFSGEIPCGWAFGQPPFAAAIAGDFDENGCACGGIEVAEVVWKSPQEAVEDTPPFRKMRGRVRYQHLSRREGYLRFLPPGLPVRLGPEDLPLKPDLENPPGLGLEWVPKPGLGGPP
jgi:hypothetical protein